MTAPRPLTDEELSQLLRAAGEDAARRFPVGEPLTPEEIKARPPLIPRRRHVAWDRTRNYIRHVIAITAAFLGFGCSPLLPPQPVDPQPSIAATYNRDEALTHATSMVLTIVSTITQAGNVDSHDPTHVTVSTAHCAERNPAYLVAAYDGISLPQARHPEVLDKAALAMSAFNIRVTSRSYTALGHALMHVTTPDGGQATISSITGADMLAVSYGSPCYLAKDSRYPGL